MRKIKYRVWDTCINKYMPFNPLCHSFEDKTLIFEQYVGNEDVNGKEIFEGDILKIRDSGERCVVKWIDTNHQQCFGLIGLEDQCPAGFYDYQYLGLEVIGTIRTDDHLIPIK